MKRGPKPRKINQDLLEKIEHHAARGLSQKQICDALGFSETWWHAKKAEYSELGESYKKGSASGLADVTNALYENAMNGNPVSQIFFLKNRDPNRWNDDKTSVSLYRVNRELLWRSNERIVNRGQFT
jgi:hypothetical protein